MSKTNTVVIKGNLAKQPELTTTKNGKSMCAVTIGHNDSWGENKHTSWVPIKMWGKTAEMACEHLVKGQEITVTGKLSADSYEKDGKKVFTWEVIAHSVDYGQKPKGAESEYTYADKKALGKATNDPRFTDDDIPF